MYRTESASLTARLIRLLGGDFAQAEEVVQEAFAAALEQWPAHGTPAHPPAWLLQTAQNKAIDRLRRSRKFEAPLSELEQEPTSPEPSEADDLLRLVFTCCHPALSLEAQIALTLRTVCGLTTDEIARAFLTSPETMAQRIVRAKHKIKVAKIPYIVPVESELAERLDAVLSVVYLVFSEGYAATSGDAWIRQDLTREAIRLGRLLERLLPNETEPVALVALMLLHHARQSTRVDASGDLVLLEDQDRSRWNHAQIREGAERVERALRRGGPTPYALQAAIAALHAQAPTAAETDWPQIVLLYRELLRSFPTSVVALNHAAAVAMTEGAEAALALLGPIEQELTHYQPFYATRAELLRRRGDYAAAARDYERAHQLAKTEPEKRFVAKQLSRIRDLVTPDGRNRNIDGT